MVLNESKGDMKIITYPEMNEKIVDVLRISDEPDKLYAAQYIENLKTSREILRSNYLLIAGAGAKE